MSEELIEDMIKNVELDEYDYHQNIARSAFADMLHDSERNQKYYLAIKEAIKKIHSQDKKANVLDIGTGSGLLSMMAVKSGADTVTACEAFQPMAQCAAKIIKHNGFEKDITIIPKRSTDLKVGCDGDLKQKANILVTELFDTELIGEGAISIFNHACEVLLEEDCIVVPSSATIYVQIIESPLIQNWNDLKNISEECFERSITIPDIITKCPGSAKVFDLQLSQIPKWGFETVSKPIPVFNFDWSKKNPLSGKRLDKLHLKRSFIQSVFMWWELNMDTENKIILSCAPYWAHPDIEMLMMENPEEAEFPRKLIPWRDHWMQAIYYFPDGILVKKEEEEVTLISCHDEYSLWFNITKKPLPDDNDYLQPICQCGLHIYNSRIRIGQINDCIRRKKYIKALRSEVNSETQGLVIGNGSLLGLIVSRLGAKHVYCLEPNKSFHPITNEFIKCNSLCEKVTVISDIKELDTETCKNISLIVSEPHFSDCLLPWDNFFFLDLLNEFKKIINNKNVKIIPKSATIKAAAVQFTDLQKIKVPILNCEGFDMKYLNEMIEKSSNIADDKIEPKSLWEYPCTALSKEQTILNVNFKNLQIIETEGSIILEKFGICNGVILWVDWNLNDNEDLTVSTGPSVNFTAGESIIWDMYTQQAVQLFSIPMLTERNVSLKYKLCVNNTIKKHIDIEFTLNAV